MTRPGNLGVSTSGFDTKGFDDDYSGWEVGLHLRSGPQRTRTVEVTGYQGSPFRHESRGSVG